MIEIFVKNNPSERLVCIAHYKTDADGNRLECTDARVYPLGTVLSVETRADGTYSVERACKQGE